METAQGRKKRFCTAYLRTMDAERAAAEAGLENGFELLAEDGVRRQLARLRGTVSGQICREDAVRRLCELAFGRANDAVRLAMEPGVDPSGLDLAAVAELKAKPDGTVEVKFIDRIRALETLCELLGAEGQGAAELFRALEEAGGEQ